MIEAHIIKGPRRYNDNLFFSVAPNERGDDMGSICGRCDLEDWCFGETLPHRKDARIGLTAPRIRKITIKDSSNCGIILDLVAKKDEVQPGFIPTPRYSTSG